MSTPNCETDTFIRVRDKSGTVLYQFDCYTKWQCDWDSYDVGKFELVCDIDHQIRALFPNANREYDYVFEYWRRNSRFGPFLYTLAYTGLNCRVLLDNEEQELVIRGHDAKCLTQRAVVLYPEPHARANPAGIATNVLANLADWNIGANALVSAGRLRDGVRAGLYVGAGGAAGGYYAGNSLTTWELYRALQHVVDANFGDVYWDIEPDGTDWAFRTWYGIRGIDRTVNGYDPNTTGNQLNGAGNYPLIFSNDFCNTSDEQYSDDRCDEINWVLSTDKSEPTLSYIAQSVAAQNDSNQAWGVRERWITGGETLDELTVDANAELWSNLGARRLQFDVVQRPNCAYQVHYDKGDRITARLFGQQLDLPIRAVRITNEPGKAETIKISFDGPIADPLERYLQNQARLLQLLAQNQRSN